MYWTPVKTAASYVAVPDRPFLVSGVVGSPAVARGSVPPDLDRDLAFGLMSRGPRPLGFDCACRKTNKKPRAIAVSYIFPSDLSQCHHQMLKHNRFWFF